MGLEEIWGPGSQKRVFRKRLGRAPIVCALALHLVTGTCGCTEFRRTPSVPGAVKQQKELCGRVQKCWQKLLSNARWTRCTKSTPGVLQTEEQPLRGLCSAACSPQGSHSCSASQLPHQLLGSCGNPCGHQNQRVRRESRVRWRCSAQR